MFLYIIVLRYLYQVVSKHGKGGKEIRMDLMIMENLLYGRQVTRVYDLKGSLRSRYNADTKGKNSVLLDQNLLESIQTNPIFISHKAKRLLERAVWNDTAFLAVSVFFSLCAMHRVISSFFLRKNPKYLCCLFPQTPFSTPEESE